MVRGGDEGFDDVEIGDAEHDRRLLVVPEPPGQQVGEGIAVIGRGEGVGGIDHDHRCVTPQRALEVGPQVFCGRSVDQRDLTAHLRGLLGQQPPEHLGGSDGAA